MKRDANEVMIEAFVTGNVGNAILNQEKRGQADLINNEVLPRECQEWEALEHFGVIRKGIVDDLFVNVTLPEGWKKVATDHSMHSSLVDEKGRKRAGIFYKAAFYDRKADMYVIRRFKAGYEPEGGWEAYKTGTGEIKKYIGTVEDGENVIWRSDVISESEEIKSWDVSGICVKLAKAWLSEHYPEWESYIAYWE